MRELHIDELNGIYSSPNIVRFIQSRRMRWARNVARMWRRDEYTGFRFGKLRGRDHLQDPGVDRSIKLNGSQEVGRGCMDWIDLAQDRERWWELVSTVMNIRVL